MSTMESAKVILIVLAVMMVQIHAESLLDEEAENGPERAGALMTQCGGTYTLFPGRSYKFQSRNYPQQSPLSNTCNRWFTVEANTRVEVECYPFQTVCNSDSFQIGTPSYKRNFCGRDLANKRLTDIPVLGYKYTLDVLFKTGQKAGQQKFDCRVRGHQGSLPTKPPQKCTCGIRNKYGKIVGGSPTEEHEYPWQVGLVYKYRTNPFCGGTIISPNWVLTAAHCVESNHVSAKDMQVRVGEHHIGQDTPKDMSVDVKRIVRHYNYSPYDRSNKYDFALLQLAYTLTFNDYIRAACLPRDDSNKYVDSWAVASGWGALKEGGQSPNVLYDVLLKVLKNDVCDKAYGVTITNVHICASRRGKDACQGDSGGPLAVWDMKNKGRMTVIGVTSFGIGCARPEYPGVYARVSTVLPWIKGLVQDACLP